MKGEGMGLPPFSFRIEIAASIAARNAVGGPLAKPIGAPRSEYVDDLVFVDHAEIYPCRLGQYFIGTSKAA